MFFWNQNHGQDDQDSNLLMCLGVVGMCVALVMVAPLGKATPPAIQAIQTRIDAAVFRSEQAAHWARIAPEVKAERIRIEAALHEQIATRTAEALKSHGAP